MDLSKYDLPCSKPIRFYIILKEAALSIRLLGALLKAVKAKLKPGAFRMPAMSDAAEGGRGAVLLSRHDTGVHGLVSASVTIFSHRYIYCPGPGGGSGGSTQRGDVARLAPVGRGGMA